MDRKPQRVGEATLVATAQLLRQRTAATHARVEDGLALLDPLLTMQRLRITIELLHRYWAAAEAIVADWSVQEPGLARSLDLGRRVRTPLFAADLKLLDITVAGTPVRDAPMTRSPLHGCDTAAVLGWLYVAEGSTLGGTVLRRRLRLADCDSVDLASTLQGFHPYAEGPGPMWRRYVDVLERWTADGTGRVDAVAEAAVHSFAVLEQWVVPTRRPDVTGVSA